MLGQRYRRWHNIETTLVQCIAYEGLMYVFVESWQYRDRKKPVVGTMPYSYRIIPRIRYSAQYHRQHCTLQALEQFRTLLMHNLDYKPLIRPRFEPSTSKFLAKLGVEAMSQLPWMSDTIIVNSLYKIVNRMSLHANVAGGGGRLYTVYLIIILSYIQHVQVYNDNHWSR